VTYNIQGFMDKNKDTQFQDLKRLLYNSDNPLMKELFPDGATPEDKMTQIPITAGTHFKNDMCQLVDLLQKQVMEEHMHTYTHAHQLVIQLAGSYSVGKHSNAS